MADTQTSDSRTPSSPHSPHSPHSPAAAAPQLTIQTCIELGVIARPDAARKLKFEYEPARTCAELRTMCADHEALPEQLRASLRLVEEDVPVVVPPNDESLLKAVNFSVLKPGATENRVAATNDELKLIVQHRPGGNVFLVDPKQNPAHFAGGQLLDGRHERDVPDDGAVSLENLGVLPNAELHLEFGAFRSFEEMGGVVVVRPPFARVHEEGRTVFIPLPADATVDALRSACAARFAPLLVNAESCLHLVVGPRRERVTDGAMELRHPALETARRLDYAASGGVYWCIDMRDERLLMDASELEYLSPLGTHADQKFDVSVRTLTGKTLQITELGPYKTVAAVKESIFAQDGIPVDQQRIVYRGVQLQCPRTLADYHIKGGEVLHMSLRLRGGMMSETSGALNYERLAALTTDVAMYDVRGELLIKMQMGGGCSARSAMILAKHADAIDKEVDALDVHQLRVRAKMLMRERLAHDKKRTRDEMGM